MTNTRTGQTRSSRARSVPTSLKAAGTVQQLDRVHRVYTGAVLDLPPARLAVAGGNFCFRLADLAKQLRSDGHRDVVLLFLDAVCAGDPAAVDIELDHAQLRHQGEQVERGLADAVAALLAGRGVRAFERPRA